MQFNETAKAVFIYRCAEGLSGTLFYGNAALYPLIFPNIYSDMEGGARTLLASENK
jgi:hypothetical protein